MLFDEILSNGNIKNESWKNEIKKWLLYIKNKGELERYLPRLTKMNGRKIWETLAEISSAYLIESILNFKVTDWDVPTRNDKNVDFTINLNAKEVYCEVKCPTWPSELSKKLKLGDRKVQPKYKNLEINWFNHSKNIRYAIIKAYPKFLSNCKNLVIINDNLFVGILDFTTDTPIKTALCNDSVAYGGIKGVFANRDYENVGGVLFVNINPSSKGSIFKYKFVGNPNALKKYTLPSNIVAN